MASRVSSTSYAYRTPRTTTSTSKRVGRSRHAGSSRNPVTPTGRSGALPFVTSARSTSNALSTFDLPAALAPEIAAHRSTARRPPTRRAWRAETSSPAGASIESDTFSLIERKFSTVNRNSMESAGATTSDHPPSNHILRPAAPP